MNNMACNNGSDENEKNDNGRHDNDPTAMLVDSSLCFSGNDGTHLQTATVSVATRREIWATTFHSRRW